MDYSFEAVDYVEPHLPSIPPPIPDLLVVNSFDNAASISYCEEQRLLLDKDDDINDVQYSEIDESYLAIQPPPADYSEDELLSLQMYSTNQNKSNEDITRSNESSNDCIHSCINNDDVINNNNNNTHTNSEKDISNNNDGDDIGGVSIPNHQIDLNNESLSTATYQISLMKKGRSGHSLLRSWRNRSFLLREQYLHYYDGTILKGSINIANSSSYSIRSNEVSEVKNKTYPFVIKTFEQEVIFLNADSELLRTNAINLFNKAANDRNWTYDTNININKNAVDNNTQIPINMPPHIPLSPPIFDNNDREDVGYSNNKHNNNNEEDDIVHPLQTNQKHMVSTDISYTTTNKNNNMNSNKTLEKAIIENKLTPMQW